MKPESSSSDLHASAPSSGGVAGNLGMMGNQLRGTTGPAGKRIQTIEEAGADQAAARLEFAALSPLWRGHYEGIAHRQYSQCWHLMVPEGRDACTLIAYMENRAIDGHEAKKAGST